MKNRMPQNYLGVQECHNKQKKGNGIHSSLNMYDFQAGHTSTICVVLNYMNSLINAIFHLSVWRGKNEVNQKSMVRQERMGDSCSKLVIVLSET